MRDEKEAYPHAFVLLAAASAAMAGRAQAPAVLDEVVGIVEERFWSETEGANLESWDRGWTEPEGYRGANANMHMVEAFLAAGRRHRGRQLVRACPADRGAADPRRRERPRLAHRRALRPAVAAAARLQRRPAAPPVQALRGDAGTRPRVVAAAAADPRGARPAARLARRRGGAAVRPRGGRTAGARPAASPTRPTWKGAPSSRTGCTGWSPRPSAPPPPCTRRQATPATSAGTGRAGTSPPPT